MAAIFDFQLTQTSDSIRTGPDVLPNPENMGIDVGISLLTDMQPKIQDWCYTYTSAVHGRHFSFRLQFSSALITVIRGNSAVLNNIGTATMRRSL